MARKKSGAAAVAVIGGMGGLALLLLSGKKKAKEPAGTSTIPAEFRSPGLPQIHPSDGVTVLPEVPGQPPIVIPRESIPTSPIIVSDEGEPVFTSLPVPNIPISAPPAQSPTIDTPVGPIQIPQIPTAPPADVQIPQPPPIASAPSQGDAATVALASKLLDREARAGWKTALKPEVKAWQKTRGLVADGLFGEKSALNMARELGTIPLIRFYPKGTSPETEVNKFRDSLACGRRLRRGAPRFTIATFSRPRARPSVQSEPAPTRQFGISVVGP